MSTAVTGEHPARLDQPRVPGRPARPLSWREGGPLLFTALNAAAFLILRPGVNDLWAARARADASAHGVGLTYWFSWFSGASTPGSYSVLTPYLSRLLSAEVVLALSAVGLVVATSLLLRTTHHPVAASYLAAVATCINLWQGRVPFVFGCAFAAVALIALRARRWVPASVLAFLSLLGSPVSAAFLGVALAAMWLTQTLPRRALLLPIGTIGLGAVLIVIIFGNPGPEPLGLGLAAGMCAVLIALLFARPPSPLRLTLYLSLAAVLLMSLIPNGMGSNFARFVWFCLPVAVLALTPGRRAYLAALSAVVLFVGSVGLFFDLRDASSPSSKADYYTQLAAELDTLSELTDYRLEVVDDGSHTAAFALLGHAILARGFETQTDLLYNADIRTQTMVPPDVFRGWLDRNAVGFVAANLHPLKTSGESDLVLNRRPAFLTPVWHDDDWAVFSVVHPTPIVELPARMLSIDQEKMTIEVPCACAITVRTRWSALLTVDRPDKTPTDATVTKNDDDYAVLTTTEPGPYILKGR